MRNFLLSLIITIIILNFLGDFACAGDDDFGPDSLLKIAIFKEEGFPSIGTPPLLTPEWVYEHLPQNFSITHLNVSELNEKEYFNPKNFDLLILPYGEAFPARAFTSIKAFLSEGGGLLNIAGRPFWTPIERRNGKWEKLNITDAYNEFLAPLGIKYYEFSDKERIGLSVTTSLAVTPVKPTHGNVFPYRIPVREFYHLSGYFENERSAEPVIFIKSWSNPYIGESHNISQKWCFISAKENSHPLDPRNAFAKKILAEIVNYLAFPCIIYGLETDFSAYRQKEKVTVSLQVLNTRKKKELCTANFVFSDKDGRIVYTKKQNIELEGMAKVTLSQTWDPGHFEDNFYKISVTLQKNGKILDKEENGFVVIDKKILNSGPSLKVSGRGFLVNGKPAYLLGVNYYESKLGELMWLRPNVLKIRDDLKSMRSLGINYVRIHYHHSKWFRDYFSTVLHSALYPYLEVSDITPFPSERSWRILDAIIQLANQEGLIFCMDIFSLVPLEMGDPIGWLGMKERISDKDKIANQEKFVRMLSSRYKDAPGITWDLWNEPRLPMSELKELESWAKRIKTAFRNNGDKHLITIGDDLSVKLLDVLDYACIHTHAPAEQNKINLDKPFIFQEIWTEAGCDLRSELKQADELKNDFKDFLKTQATGFVPWQWTRQARLWDNLGDAEKWDDELGVCAHEDGTLKPAGHAYGMLIRQLSGYKK